MTERKLDCIIEHIWTTYDTDKSGYLEANEIETMLTDIFKQTKHRVSNEHIKIFLSVLDSNGDGRIEKNELRELLIE